MKGAHESAGRNMIKTALDGPTKNRARQSQSTGEIYGD